MAYATVSDVTIYVPELEEGLEDTVETLLDQAEAQILIEFPDLDQRVADGRTNIVLLKRVEAEMVSSVMRNPNGYSSESLTIGSFSRSHSVNANVASGLLVFTSRHRTLIRGAVRGSRAFSVRVNADPPSSFIDTIPRSGWWH